MTVQTVKPEIVEYKPWLAYNDDGIWKCLFQNEGVSVDSELEIVRVKSWERFEWLRHGFSTRAGGVSSAYGGNSLNLGWTTEDNAASVSENRQRFLRSVGKGAEFGLVGVRQIHSGIVRMVQEGDGALEGRLQTTEGKAVLEGDGLITDVPGVMVGVGTADCVPVLVIDEKKRVVGAFHAGWRGTVAQIVENGVAMMVSTFGSQVADLTAAVGPSIGACCYAVGNEVRAAFGRPFRYAEELFRVREEEDSAEMYLDLWKANFRQLLNAGLDESRITVVGECTACAMDGSGRRKYFSHRGEEGVAGRMLNVVGVV
jgi:polyphenol oxidase